MTSSNRFQTVSQTAIYAQVADQIRDAVLEGKLAHGDRLPAERELARQFGVSRATVREALRHLQAEGLLHPRGRTAPMAPADGDVAAARFREALAHVVRLRDVSLPDLVQLRLAIEGAALAGAAEARLPEALEQARAALAEMERPQTTGAHFYRADVAFHLALVAASGNQAFLEVMRAVRESIELHLDDAVGKRSLAAIRDQVTDEHRAILRAVERGNKKSVASLLARHIAGFYGT